MKNLFSPSVLFAASLWLGAGLISAYAEASRSQTLQLQPGWNSIYLEVDPIEKSPASLFENQPVDIVASYSSPRNGAQFVENPSADMLNAYGWAVWYAERRSDDFLTTLYSIEGDQPYLIHSETNATLTIEGTLPTVGRNWIPDAFNYVGFTVQNPGAPTFEQFFSASPAHNHNRIYRLVNGTWRQVTEPGNELMRSGEAFWIYCDGESDYAGPLEVTAPSVLGVVLYPESGSEVIFRNQTDHPISFVMDHLPAGNESIPMATVIRTVDEEGFALRNVTVPFDNGTWSQNFPPLEGGEAIRLPLELRAAEASPGVNQSLLRVQSDLGTETYLSVLSVMEDVAEAQTP